VDKPVVAITMGDAAGIGPELVVKVLSQGWVREMCQPFVVGDLKVMRTIGRVVGTTLQFAAIEKPSQARFVPSMIDVLCPTGLQVKPDAWGVLDPAMGQAAAQCLRAACELATAGQIRGMVSAPLNKEAFHLAGYAYQDELAYIADLTASPQPFIVGAVRSLLTVSVTEHIAFRDIVGLIKKDRVLWYIRKMDQTLRQVGVSRPRIAVAALNVHGGEGGLFGREEIEHIAPAIQEALGQGLDVVGPVPADTVFVRALEGEFDGVVCMYHDQANIARKLQPRSEGATLFMGLPVPCGTTAHGTAFDKAGQGIADPGSLAAALKYTAMLAGNERIMQ
jgi:4-hydroxythreonine-4-phosphate dehydrogenase